MKHMSKRIAAMLLALVLVVGLIGSAATPKAQAALKVPNNSLRQETNVTCTLASCTMIIRARFYLSNNSGWSAITESMVRPYGWIEGAGVRASNWNYYYGGNRVTIGESFVGGLSLSYLKSLLDQHPEGIGLYCGRLPHCIYISDYDGDTIYCSDPGWGYSGNRRPLSASYLGAVYGSQQGVLNNTTAFFYCTSYSIAANANLYSETPSEYLDNAVFNAEYYRNNNVDLRNMNDDQLKDHWLNYGIKEGRRASAAFDVRYYLNTYADLRNAYGTDYKSALSHFVSFGMKEGRTGASGFDLNFYRANNVDLRKAYGYDNASYYRHYAIWGYKENRSMTRTPVLVDGVYKVYSAGNQNFALNIAGNSKDNQGNLQLWDKGAAHNIIIKCGSDGYYTMKVEISGKYIEAYGNYSSNGSNVSQYDGNGTDAQKWSIRQNGDGTYSFFACANGKAMDVCNGNMANGANIQLYDDNGTAAQKWVLVAQKTVADGYYKIAANTNANQSLNVAGDSTEASANIQIWNHAGNMYSRVIGVEYVSDGYYRLKMPISGLYFDVCNWSTADGAQVLQYGYHGGANQLWRIIPTGDGSYNIVSKNGDKYLDRNGGSDANGTKVQIWTPNGTNAQKWTFTKQSLSGKMGWVMENGARHYYENEVMVTGAKKIGTNWYYFDANGNMYTGWLKNNAGQWLYYQENGASVRDSWARIDGSTFYFNQNGCRVTGKQTISGRSYTFADNGVLQSK